MSCQLSATDILEICVEYIKAGNHRAYEKFLTQNLTTDAESSHLKRLFAPNEPSYLFTELLQTAVQYARPKMLQQFLDCWKQHSEADFLDQEASTNLLLPIYISAATNYDTEVFEILQTYFPKQLTIYLKNADQRRQLFNAALQNDQYQLLDQLLQKSQAYAEKKLLFDECFSLLRQLRFGQLFFDTESRSIKMLQTHFPEIFEQSFTRLFTDILLQNHALAALNILTEYDSLFKALCQKQPTLPNTFLEIYSKKTEPSATGILFAIQMHSHNASVQRSKNVILPALKLKCSESLKTAEISNEFSTAISALKKASLQLTTAENSEILTVLLQETLASLSKGTNSRHAEVLRTLRALLELFPEKARFTNLEANKSLTRQLRKICTTAIGMLSANLQQRVSDDTTLLTFQTKEPLFQLLKNLQTMPAIHSSVYNLIQYSYSAILQENLQQNDSLGKKKVVSAETAQAQQLLASLFKITSNVDLILSAIFSPLVRASSSYLEMLTEDTLRDFLQNEKISTTSLIVHL